MNEGANQSLFVVAYGLDIGIYGIGKQGRVLLSNKDTRTAWCRTESAPRSLHDNVTYRPHESFTFAGTLSVPCGRDIEQLANCISDDLLHGNAVVLGFEAPMWFPTMRRHCANHKLFAPRFMAENDPYQWYNQVGGPETLKAISLGFLLFSILSRKCGTIDVSTDPEHLAPDRLFSLKHLLQALIAN